MLIKKLNLGSGKNPKEGYINVHIRDDYSIDIQHDLEVFPWPFKDGSFNLIEIDHVLEHLSDIKLVIYELDRILSKNGTLIIGVPHFSRGITHWDHESGFNIRFSSVFSRRHE